MRAVIFILLFLTGIIVLAQKDTIVVTDYTKVMIVADASGNVSPVTSLDEVDNAGFFLNGRPAGDIRICHTEELFVWVDGQLFDAIDGCVFYAPEVFFERASSDTIYVAFSANKSLAGLSCDLVIFEDLLVVKEDIANAREVSDSFTEFAIVSLLILLMLVGIIGSQFPSRVAYLFEKSLTFKISAYEYINTGFFAAPSMYLMLIYSFALAFVTLYLEGLTHLDLFILPSSTMGCLLLWLKVGGVIFLLLLVKWAVISVIALLFKFRGLKNFQLFDFLNFNVLLLIPMVLILVLDFVLNHPSDSWVSDGFVLALPISMILFVIWFTLKFVSNSPRRKLIIISYLCATEIIPLILLMGWFYK